VATLTCFYFLFSSFMVMIIEQVIKMNGQNNAIAVTGEE
jgi:hypothetical protein